MARTSPRATRPRGREGRVREELGHRANILKLGVAEIGVGHDPPACSYTGNYWTQNSLLAAVPWPSGARPCRRAGAATSPCHALIARPRGWREPRRGRATARWGLGRAPPCAVGALDRQPDERAGPSTASEVLPPYLRVPDVGQREQSPTAALHVEARSAVDQHHDGRPPCGGLVRRLASVLLSHGVVPLGPLGPIGPSRLRHVRVGRVRGSKDDGAGRRSGISPTGGRGRKSVDGTGAANWKAPKPSKNYTSRTCPLIETQKDLYSAAKPARTTSPRPRRGDDARRSRSSSATACDRAGCGFAPRSGSNALAPAAVDGPDRVGRAVWRRHARAPRSPPQP
jgi:hypothetical protein